MEQIIFTLDLHFNSGTVLSHRFVMVSGHVPDEFMQANQLTGFHVLSLNNLMFTQDWSGQTCCIIASGPSLRLCDVSYARQHVNRIIVVNELWRMCPDADLLYGADEEWWKHRAPSRQEFQGERWTINLSKTNWPIPDVRVAEGKFDQMVAFDGPITTGMNSSFQAMQIAMRRGVRNMVFLGLDMKLRPGKSHWHGDHRTGLRNPSQGLLDKMAACFVQSAPVLAEHGYRIVNASPDTALTCFPQMPIEDAVREISTRTHLPE